MIDSLLVFPEGAGKFHERLRPLYKTYIARFLVAQYPNSPLKNCLFSDAKQEAFLLRTATETEVAVRKTQVPPFPEELRAKLMAQLKEELMGRRSSVAASALTKSNGGNNTTTIVAPNAAQQFEGALSGRTLPS